MPLPLSCTTSVFRPPAFALTTTAVAPASSEFSSICATSQSTQAQRDQATKLTSFSAADGRCTTSPAAMRFTTASSSRRMRGAGAGAGGAVAGSGTVPAPAAI